MSPAQHLTNCNHKLISWLSIARMMACFKSKVLSRRQRVVSQSQSTMRIAGTTGSTSVPSPALSRTKRSSGWSRATSITSTRTSQPYSIGWRDQGRLLRSLSSSKEAAWLTKRLKTWPPDSTSSPSLSSCPKTSQAPTIWRTLAPTARSTRCAYATP